MICGIPNACLREVKEMVECRLASPTLTLQRLTARSASSASGVTTKPWQEDNISLLRGMGEKEIKSYSRKGIFTVIQLAETFRPRRRGKRSPTKEQPLLPCTARARTSETKESMFSGCLEIPEPPVHIYMDVEGDPEQGFDYLVGIVVVQGENEQRYFVLGG